MGDNNSLEDKLEGVLDFFFETGSEGGSWAFQDSHYIRKNVPKSYCKKCGIYMIEQSGPLKVQRVTLLDEEVLEEFWRTGEIREKPECADGEHEEKIGDVWSYEGLHLLDNGDHLTIYHPDNKKEVWSGVINLRLYDQFTEHASGMWIHTDQIGIERDIWAKYFFEQYPAVLIPSNKTPK